MVLVSLGLFAWVPFAHAASRLRTPKARRYAWLFGAIDAVLYVLVLATPETGPEGEPSVGAFGGLLALTAMILGCVLISPLRRQVYEGAPQEGAPASASDPAVAAALAARAKRDEARTLVADDPLLARELKIGRPDLAGTYDDGGLVDLGAAPAEAIAQTCGLTPEQAATIVRTRGQQGTSFFTVEELLIAAELPVEVWDRVRDRAILLV
ncbi:hypothetical protein C1701_12290 [Actinoalloteichus sp. AHMU CJ021]|nr:hypothetical protein C1701_12290 [Actinoalloteichus sp. AHMU CJ021]